MGLNLSWNPFVCDCKLSWLPRWVEDRRVRVLEASDTRCAHPPEVANLSLFDVLLLNASCGKEGLGWGWLSGTGGLGGTWGPLTPSVTSSDLMNQMSVTQAVPRGPGQPQQG
ncbi:hypothetical protein EK904_007645 [Melospiza melodia maxima]|nr:hypothetical protein EK904_007645 [Melospiza melodia maxima]